MVDFTRIFASNGTSDTISDSDYNGGLENIVGANPPTKPQFNAIWNELDNKIAALDARSSSSPVSVDGELSLSILSIAEYKISNYDSFSTYSVSIDNGSVSVADDIITVTAPAAVGTSILTITKDGTGYDKTISIVGAGVTAPSNSSPLDNAEHLTNTITLTSSAFSWFGTADTHATSEWQLSTDAGFNTIVDSTSLDAVNLTTWTPSITLAVSETYYWRVRYTGVNNGRSNWSQVTTFNTPINFFNDLSQIDGLSFGDMVDAGNYDATTDTGFFGVASSYHLITGSELLISVGVTTGTPVNTGEGWLKFYVGANAGCNRSRLPHVLYIAKKIFATDVSFGEIYLAGAAYGPDNFGDPAGTLTIQDASVVIDGETLIARLPTGDGNDSEWDDLIYRVHESADSGSVSIPQEGANWANFTDDEIVFTASAGTYTWCQETSPSSISRRITRNGSAIDSAEAITTRHGYRPTLVFFG